MKPNMILYVVLILVSVVSFIGGQWAGALTAFVLTLILITSERILATLVKIKDQLEYQNRHEMTRDFGSDD